MNISRRTFLTTCGTAATALCAVPRLEAATEVVRLKSWEIVEFPNLSAKRRKLIKKEFLSGPWLLAPDWPGIYQIE